MLRILLAVAIGATGNLIAADVSGRWAGTMETPGGAVRVYLTVAQHDHTVSGDVSTEDENNPAPMEEPEIRGDVLTFQVHDNANRIVRFRLALTNLSMTGESRIDDRVSRVSFWRSDLMSTASSDSSARHR